MPFGEVMYRCNAHYCFSVFRNRVVGLLTTLALMQLFLFSFYLNGLHSEAVVTRNDLSNYLVDDPSGSKLPASDEADVNAALGSQPQPPVMSAGRRGPLPEEEPEIPVDQKKKASRTDDGAKGQGQVQLTGLAGLALPNNLVNQLTDLLSDPSKSKAVGEAAKKALDNVLAAGKPDLMPLQLMAMAANAAKKISPSVAKSADPSPDMTKIGFNLLANAFNTINKPKSPEDARLHSSSPSLPAAAKGAVSRGPQAADPSGQSVDKESDAFGKYADLAKMGLQLFGSELLSNDQPPSGKNAAVNGLLETAAQMVLQQQDARNPKSALDAVMTKTAIGMLTNALGNQKMDPKTMLNMASMAAKVLQSPSQQSGQHGNDLMASLNLLSKLVPSGARPSGASASVSQAATGQSRWNQSDDIYSDYVRYTARRLNLAAIKSKLDLPPSSSSSKDVLLDIDFSFVLPQEEIDTCEKGDYIVLVVSALDNYELRQAARQTWIDQLQRLSPRVRIFFIVGQRNQQAESVDQSIQAEWRKYRDVIQAVVPDSPANAALKTTAGLLWVYQNCPQVKQILKSEDDVFINPPKMLQIIDSQQDLDVLVGQRVSDGNPHNSHDLKHAVEGEVWPWNKYPPFLLGGAYVIGKGAIPHLLAAVQVTPVFPVEDVYITGLCSLGGQLDTIHHDSFFSEWLSEELDVCTFSDYASWRSTGAKDIIQTWKLAQSFKKNNRKCTRTKRCAATFMGLCLPSS